MMKRGAVTEDETVPGSNGGNSAVNRRRMLGLLAVSALGVTTVRAQTTEPERYNAWTRRLASQTAYRSVPGLVDRPIGLSTWLDPDADSLPIYTATASDPLVPVRYVEEAWSKVASGAWRRSDNTASAEQEIRAAMRDAFPYPGNVYSSQSATAWVLPEWYHRRQNPSSGPRRAYVPTSARAAPGTDGHLAVRQPDGNVLELYAGIRLNSGEWCALTYALTRESGPGDGYQNGVTAAMVPVYSGVIRRSELDAGTIPHALKLLAPAALLTTAFTYPAVAFDRGALTETPPYSGTLAMGAKLAIPLSRNLNDLGLETEMGRILARAAQTYGMIVVDRGGDGVTVCVERAAASHPLLVPTWEAYSDTRRILSATRRVIPT